MVMTLPVLCLCSDSDWADMLPLCLAICVCHASQNHKLGFRKGGGKVKLLAYRFRPVQHANTEIPEK